jgi:uncharacterized LabA/DUF88 family protein
VAGDGGGVCCSRDLGAQELDRNFCFLRGPWDDGIVVVGMAQQREFQGDGRLPPYNTEADLAAGLAASSRGKRGNQQSDTTQPDLACQFQPAPASAPRAHKTIVYVDGFNLYYGALRRTPYRWLDLRALCRAMLPQDDVVSINYYTALVSARPGNPSAPNDQQIYLRALRTMPALSITLGHFLTHSVQMSLSGVTPTQRVWVDKTEEKGSDVNIAAHMVRDACMKRCDVAVLISNDSDLAEPVRIVRQEFGLHVGILNPHQHHSVQLKRLATFLKRIRQSDLIASQFPTDLHDGKGAFHKPSGW